MEEWGLNEKKDDGALNAGIYLRVSTMDQKEGHGIALQQTKCEAMATVKGWTINKIYKDEGVSGTIKETERPGFSKLIKDAKNKVIDAVIVYAMDRLGRRTQIVLRTIENLSEMGIKVVSCRENLDTSTAAGTFMVTIFAALAQLERDTIVERMKAGTEVRRKIDGDIGGKVPSGYARKDGTVVIDEGMADTVRYIYHRRYIDFRFMNEIADELNEMGVAQRTKKGKRWDKTIVHSILKNEAKYLGGYRNESKFKWPRILPDDFEEQEKRAITAKEEQERLGLDISEKFTTNKFRRKRKIKRPKQALAQLRAMRNGEVIPHIASIKPQKEYIEEPVIIKPQKKSKSNSKLLDSNTPKLRIPSPEHKHKSLSAHQQPQRKIKVKAHTNPTPETHTKSSVIPETQTHPKTHSQTHNINPSPQTHDVNPSLIYETRTESLPSPPKLNNQSTNSSLLYPKPPPVRRRRKKDR